MVLTNILGFILKKFSFKEFTYVTSLNTSLQLLYLSKTLRPFKFITKNIKTIINNRLQNTTQSMFIQRHRTPNLPINAPHGSTNFSNNNFYLSKQHLASTHWVMVGNLFNDNSSDLLPLKDWRFTNLLNSAESQPSKLIIKKRFRSWSFKKSPINFDRRARLHFRKAIKISPLKTNYQQAFNSYRHRSGNNKSFKLNTKRNSFIRWAAIRSTRRNRGGYNTGLSYRSVTRKIRRMLTPIEIIKRLRLLRLKRLKKIGYRFPKSRTRFVSTRSRTKRLNVKPYLRRYFRSQPKVRKYGKQLHMCNMSRSTKSYDSSLKARSIRRPFTHYLHKPSRRPYVRFRLTPLKKYRRFRGRGRRYRNLFQKNFSTRSKSLIKSGLVIRMIRWIRRSHYKTRHFRLPPTDYANTKPKKTGRWKHSYPYLFTNDVSSNKKLGRSTVQNLISLNLTPIRSKRQKRVKLNTYKKFARLKAPRWTILKSSKDTRPLNLATKTQSRAKIGSMRELAFLGFSRWAGAVSRNSIQLYLTTPPRKYTMAPRISTPTRRQVASFTLSKRQLRVGRHKSLKPYQTNSRLAKTQNFKLRLSWLLKSGQVSRYRLPSHKCSPNLPILYRSKIIPKSISRTKALNNLDTLKTVKSIYCKVSFTKVSTPYTTLPMQTTISQQTPVVLHHTPTSPSLKTRTNINFILKPYLQFFNRLLLRNPVRPYTYKYMFKKKLYSFLYPNQVRNTLLSRKKKITFYKLVYKTKLITRSRPFYRPRNLKKYFNLNEFTQGLNRTGSIFGPTEFSSPTKVMGNFKNQLHDVANENHFSLRGGDNSFKVSEVRIPRIKFKPGYQRLWRQARTALQESLKLRFIYQKKLSRYIVRFFKQTNSYTFSRSEMSLEKTLMYSRLLPDLPTVNVFVQQNLVYLNGLPATTTKASVFQNDLLQLIISKWYYIAYRWIANWTLKRHKKFKRLVYRKGLAGKHRVMKLRKQKSYYTPHWIYLARYDISDIKPYLEVDYMTLSVCIVYNPYLLYYYSPDDTPDLRSTIYRLYNWKYIT